MNYVDPQLVTTLKGLVGPCAESARNALVEHQMIAKVIIGYKAENGAAAYTNSPDTTLDEVEQMLLEVLAKVQEQKPGVYSRLITPEEMAAGHTLGPVAEGTPFED